MFQGEAHEEALVWFDVLIADERALVGHVHTIAVVLPAEPEPIGDGLIVLDIVAKIAKQPPFICDGESAGDQDFLGYRPRGLTTSGGRNRNLYAVT